VGKDLQQAIRTVMDVQNDRRTVDQHVQNALAALASMDTSILSDEKKITAAFLGTVGDEYRPILEEDRMTVMAQAKMSIGNDLSAWSISDLATLQRILKKALQEKAKKEKLARAKISAENMDAQELRRRVQKFMDHHPEFCDAFLD
jgi:hypothetical protein